jgi:hypothetical protein
MLADRMPLTHPMSVKLSTALAPAVLTASIYLDSDFSDPVAREIAEDRGAVRWAGTAGERLAAEAALERVRARLGELSRQDPSIEMQFSMPDRTHPTSAVLSDG